MILEMLSGQVHADSTENMGGLVFDRIPKPRVSAMDNLYTGFNFIVSLNEFTYGFQSVSNIQRHREVAYVMEGGVNDHQILVGRPNDNSYTMALRRGYIMHAPDDVMNKFALAGVARIPNETARKMALIALNATRPQAALENGPSLGFIQVYSRRKKLIAMFSFLSLGMTEWSFSNLEAQSSEIIFEDITITHTGLTLLPSTWMPSISQPIMSWAGTNEDSMATMTAIVEKNKEDFEKRKEEIKKLEEEKKNKEKEREELLKKRAELIANKEDDYSKRMEAQQSRLEEQKARDEENVNKVRENTKQAFDQIGSENEQGLASDGNEGNQNQSQNSEAEDLSGQTEAQDNGR